VLAARTTGASWDFADPEVDRLVEELNQEKLALAKQREQLDQLAKRLEVERAELNAVTQAVHQVRTEIDRTYLRVQGEEAKNLKRLAKMFATMQPETAVKVMDQLGDQEMVKLLALMKDDQVTPIFEFIAGQGEEQAKRAAALAQQMRQAIIEHAQP
jgi:flagellar motility protein MotE (MotC chaperone)